MKSAHKKSLVEMSLVIETTASMSPEIDADTLVDCVVTDDTAPTLPVTDDTAPTLPVTDDTTPVDCVVTDDTAAPTLLVDTKTEQAETAGVKIAKILLDAFTQSFVDSTKSSTTKEPDWLDTFIGISKKSQTKPASVGADYKPTVDSVLLSDLAALKSDGATTPVDQVANSPSEDVSAPSVKVSSEQKTSGIETDYWRILSNSFGYDAPNERSTSDITGKTRKQTNQSDFDIFKALWNVGAAKSPAPEVTIPVKPKTSHVGTDYSSKTSGGGDQMTNALAQLIGQFVINAFKPATKPDAKPCQTPETDAKPETISTFLCRKPNLDVLNRKGPGGQTPLHLAVSARDEVLVARLLKAGVDVSIVDNQGRTPLHLALSEDLKGPVTALLLDCVCPEDLMTKLSK